MTTLQSLRFARAEHNRLLFGVSGGLAKRLGVDSLLVRVAFVLLAVDLGLGIALYFAAHALTKAGETFPDGERFRPVTNRHNLGFAVLLLSLLLFARAIGLWIGDAIMWPCVFAAIGSTIILLRSDNDAQRWENNRLASIFGSQPSRLRLAFGTVAVVLGVAAFLATNRTATGDARTLLAVGATALGMLLIFGPWLTRLGRQVIDERNRGIRSQERAEVGAHLHDSVLQTLAMIQRAESPEQMTSLARRQERELRAWLHGQSLGDETTVKTALEDFAARIDEDHQVAITIVVVGDRVLDEQIRPLVAATQEAMTNAARHSGAKTAHVYVEITDEQATALIRDEGTGFDNTAIAADRQGIRESIEGRMRRHGGQATIHSTPGHGTEINLVLAFRKREW